jgi:thiamine pyrophosphate-dependent acetolactate synthase large subunit-like protein
MAASGGDTIGKILSTNGVNLLFALCGGHISPILTGAVKNGLRVIDVRHEATAVFAADAAARLTGVPGVAVVTAGPGVTNTLTALQNARMAQSPVLLFGGAVPTVLKGRGALQDMDHLSLLKSIVKRTATIRRFRDIGPVLARAFETAQSGVPGPVFVECPADLLYPEAMVREWYGSATGKGEKKGLKSRLVRYYLDRRLDKMFKRPLDDLPQGNRQAGFPRSDPHATDNAGRLIAGAKRPVLIVGSQAMLHASRVDIMADAVRNLGIPVFLTGMARGLLGRDHPLQMRHRRSEALKEADAVLVAGMPLDFRLGYGRSIGRGARVVAVNRSRKDLNLNRRPDLGVHTDPHQFLCDLAGKATGDDARWKPWIDRLKARDRSREAEIEVMAGERTDHINPLRLLKKIDGVMDDRSLIVVDGGDFVAGAAYILAPRTPLSWLDPGSFGTLGVGGGFALGAALTRPGAEIWLIYGDGAAGYSLQEIDTFVRHGVSVIAVIGNDAGWTQIARDQVRFLKDDVGTVLRATDYHLVAEGYGGKGFFIDQESEIDDVLRKARAAAQRGRPVVVNARIGRTRFREGSISM